MINKNRLEELIINDNKTLENAKKRIENSGAIHEAMLISLKVLKTLKTQKLKQKDLAIKMGVSAQQVNKIIRGSENLTLETLNKLEKALGAAFLPSSVAKKVKMKFAELDLENSIQKEIRKNGDIKNLKLDNVKTTKLDNNKGYSISDSLLRLNNEAA
jgi:transcriptional regulator with XRE-family HTH domain